MHPSMPFLLLNDAAVELFGYDYNELLGENISLICGGEHAAKHDQYMKNYLRTNVTKIMGRSAKYQRERNVEPSSLWSWVSRKLKQRKMGQSLLPSSKIFRSKRSRSSSCVTVSASLRRQLIAALTR